MDGPSKSLIAAARRSEVEPPLSVFVQTNNINYVHLYPKDGLKLERLSYIMKFLINYLIKYDLTPFNVTNLLDMNSRGYLDLFVFY